MISRDTKKGIPFSILAVIFLMALLIGMGATLFYSSQKKKIENEKRDELAAIASLKINQIANWRKEHIRDGHLIGSNAARDQMITSFLENKGTPGLGKELQEGMKIVISDYDYHNLLLVDKSGFVRLVYPPSNKVLSSYTLLPTETNNNSEISLSNLHYSDDLPGKIHIDLQIPVFASKENKNVRIGTMVLRIDPEITLYPLIQSWPTLSKSSETLLIKLEDDSVLFLNELRHQKNTALKLKLPMRNDLPASRAVQGYEGIFEGMDYRGIPVVSYLNKIPYSDWFIVAKVDKKEMYASLFRTLFFTLIISSLLIFLVGFSMIYFWRSQRIKYLRELNSTKDKFFSIVSHDLRGPVSGINNLSNILVEELQNNDRAKLDVSSIKNIAGLIRSSSSSTFELLNNLTEWSTLNTNRLRFNPQEIDLVPIINNVIELMKIAAGEKSITINKTTPSQLKIYADKEMINLVLRNLISNSVKFTNRGGNIQISAFEKNNKFRVDVYDTGVGIEQDVIEKLFGPEENVSTPGTRNERGTGLGLVLVKEFVSLHGGQVFVESKVGLYSRFSFIIPLNKL